MTAAPNFVGIGGQKCASTWLSECMRAHPEVFMSSPKELRFFSEKWPQGLSWYLKFFESAGKYRYRGEFSSNYLYHPESAQRMKDMLGDIKIIAIVREPVERTLSHIKHLIRDGDIAKISGKISEEQLKEILRLHPQVFSNSFYWEGLQRFVRIFGENSVFVVNKSTTKENGPLILGELWKFLELNGSVRIELANKTVSRGINPNSMLLEVLRKKLFAFFKFRAPSVINWAKYSGLSYAYRTINRGDSLEFSANSIKYLQNQFAEDWTKTQKFLTVKR